MGFTLSPPLSLHPFQIFQKAQNSTSQPYTYVHTYIHTYLCTIPITPMYFYFLSNLSPSFSLKLPMHAVWAILTFDFMMAYALPQIIFRSFCTLSCWWRRYVRFRLLTKAPGQTDQAIWRSLWWTRALFCFERYDRVCLIDRRREGRERPQTEEKIFFSFFFLFFHRGGGVFFRMHSIDRDW